MLTPLHRAGSQHALDLSSRPNRQQSSTAYQFFQSNSIAAIGGAPVQPSVPVGSVPSGNSQVLDSLARTRQYSGPTAGIISPMQADAPASAAGTAAGVMTGASRAAETD